MQASVFGRLGKDAQTIQTKSGKPMAAASLAVDVSPRDSEATAWFRVVAFGRLAEQLARHQKGDTLAASGRVELSCWTGDDGQKRESWQLIADALHSARTVKRAGGDGAAASRPATAPGVPFNDSMPF